MNIKKQTAETTGNSILAHQKLSFAATEAYKLLRTNLMFSLPDYQKCRVVGVTSSVRGEGKSTTAVNLSYTLAETGKKVLLIDADLRLPSVGKKLEIESVPGVTNVIAGTCDLSQAIRTWEDAPDWGVLPSGDIPPNPTEMLGSPQMQTLMTTLSESYDFIIVDLPPVNIVSDALVMSSLLDGMLVVVRENYSERRALNNCTRQLELSNVKVLGFVMNVTSEGSGKYGRYSKNKYYKQSKNYHSYGYGQDPEKERTLDQTAKRSGK